MTLTKQSKIVNLKRMKNLFLIFLKQFENDEFSLLMQFLQLIVNKYNANPSNLFGFLTDQLEKDEESCYVDEKCPTKSPKSFSSVTNNSNIPKNKIEQQQLKSIKKIVPIASASASAINSIATDSINIKINNTNLIKTRTKSCDAKNDSETSSCLQRPRIVKVESLSKIVSNDKETNENQIDDSDQDQSQDQDKDQDQQQGESNENDENKINNKKINENEKVESSSSSSCKQQQKSSNSSQTVGGGKSRSEFLSQNVVKKRINDEALTANLIIDEENIKFEDNDDDDVDYLDEDYNQPDQTALSKTLFNLDMLANRTDILDSFIMKETDEENQMADNENQQTEEDNGDDNGNNDEDDGDDEQSQDANTNYTNKNKRQKRQNRMELNEENEEQNEYDENNEYEQIEYDENEEGGDGSGGGNRNYEEVTKTRQNKKNLKPQLTNNSCKRVKLNESEDPDECDEDYFDEKYVNCKDHDYYNHQEEQDEDEEDEADLNETEDNGCYGNEYYDDDDNDDDDDEEEELVNEYDDDINEMYEESDEDYDPNYATNNKNSRTTTTTLNIKNRQCVQSNTKNQRIAKSKINISNSLYLSQSEKYQKLNKTEPAESQSFKSNNSNWTNNKSNSNNTNPNQTGLPPQHSIFEETKGRVRKFSEFIRNELESKFLVNNFISGVEKTMLARKLNLTERQVQKWFVHRREKLRRLEKKSAQLQSVIQSQQQPPSLPSSSSSSAKRTFTTAQSSSSITSTSSIKQPPPPPPQLPQLTKIRVESTHLINPSNRPKFEPINKKNLKRNLRSEDFFIKDKSIKLTANNFNEEFFDEPNSTISTNASTNNTNTNTNNTSQNKSARSDSNFIENETEDDTFCHDLDELDDDREEDDREEYAPVDEDDEEEDDEQQQEQCDDNENLFNDETDDLEINENQSLNFDQNSNESEEFKENNEFLDDKVKQESIQQQQQQQQQSSTRVNLRRQSLLEKQQQREFLEIRRQQELEYQQRQKNLLKSQLIKSSSLLSKQKSLTTNTGIGTSIITTTTTTTNTASATATINTNANVNSGQRKLFPSQVVKYLEQIFDKEKYLKENQVDEICQATNLNEKQVRSWFKQRRYKYNLEIRENGLVEDYGFKQRTNLPKTITAELERAFIKNNYVSGIDKKNLSRRLNLKPIQLERWFYYRRKKQSQN